MAEPSLETIRAELRRRGYLQRGVERFLLQDALRPRSAVAAIVRLALRVGLLLGILGAVAGGVGLALVNGALRAHPADAAALSLHLLLPAVVATSVGFLLVSAPFALAFRASRRAAERMALGLAIAASSAWVLFVAARGRALLAEGSRGWALALGLGAAAVAWMLGRVLYDGLLALAARFSRLEPGGFAVPRWALGAVAVLGCAALVGPGLLASGEGTPSMPPFLPTAPGERVLLVGVDGVMAQELDYLLANGDLPAIASRRARGGAVLRYERPVGPPASLWTSVATGLAPAAHGVVGVDSYRPLGVTVPLVRSGPLRGWWKAETVLGLCEYRPVLSARRQGWTVWELAARGGGPVAAIDWWSTFPAEPLPGLVVAHGAYQLLAERAAGAVAPAARQEAMLRLRASEPVAALDEQLRAALPGDGAEDLLARAVRPDLFYLEAARLAIRDSPRSVAVYLPGLDIAGAGWRGSDVAFADLVRALLTAVDRLVADSEEFGTVAVVLDPGRRGGAEGRVLLLRRGCDGSSSTSPEVVAASLLRALGLPQSAEVPAPASVCAWPPAPAMVPSYGARRAATSSEAASQEYLENLRALGYL